ncbi:MAG: hypothetical protein AAF385_08590 [Pseudomonadota bacterium]
MHILLARSAFDTQQIAGNLVTRTASPGSQTRDELSILARLLHRPDLQSRSAAGWRSLQFPDHPLNSICADLVCLQAGLDTVAVGPPVLDVSASDAKAISESIRGVFSDSDWFFELGANGQGLVFSATELRGYQQASYRLGDKNLRDLPGLSGALQTLDAELQMLLFDHPVNLRRAEQGRAPLSGLWFWDSEPIVAEDSAQRGNLPILFSIDATLVAAWNENNGQVHAEAAIEKLQCPDWVVVLDSMTSQQAVLSYLNSGPVRPCYFVDRYGKSFELRSPSMLQRLLQRLSA